eukprot:CAMPEP_0174739698 /NCGR_PEP_ID=MMETSP1094-20130205/72040_1 /TAXON_ID=156173 /ORGANISM="Chrysochromulina brevifilum, Strain UTEX LB 985" /LENGTH=71 /DNA_ID=CAMNT_0015943287 /DNA_START=73 /DNA_END=288 /DNA_ORIENTATION=+
MAWRSASRSPQVANAGFQPWFAIGGCSGMDRTAQSAVALGCLSTLRPPALLFACISSAHLSLSAKRDGGTV